MSAIREEVVKLTKFKGDDDMYGDDPQEYLSALLVAIDKMSAKDYDRLSDDAFNWHVEAVKAKDNDQEIPDFPDNVEDDPEGARSETQQEADSEDEPAEAEADNEPADGEDGSDDDADDAETDEGDDPVAAEPEPPVKQDNPAKPKKAAKEEVDKPKSKKPKVKNFKNTRDYTTLTGEKDKFGVTIGTKKHEAVKMYEKGCTAGQLEDTIGGRHYNVLKELMAVGHKVEKLEGGVWKLIHKDSVKKKK